MVTLLLGRETKEQLTTYLFVLNFFFFYFSASIVYSMNTKILFLIIGRINEDIKIPMTVID